MSAGSRQGCTFLLSAGRLWRKDDTARWGCGGTAFLIAGGKTNALASLCSPRHSRMGIRVGSGRCHGLVGVGNGRVAVEGNDEKIGACQRVLSTIICRGRRVMLRRPCPISALICSLTSVSMRAFRPFRSAREGPLERTGSGAGRRASTPASNVTTRTRRTSTNAAANSRCRHTKANDGMPRPCAA